MQRGEVRPEDFQVVADFRHRADGAAGGADGVALLDGDGRRDALDAVYRRLVHAVEELPRVGREGLDVAPLALGEERVEGERGLAGAGETGDDDEFAERQIEVEALEVVVPHAPEADEIGRRRLRHESGN